MTLPMPPRALFACLPLALALAACQHAPAPTATAAAAAPRVLLLGEVHDSAAGHAARVALLRKDIEAGWRPAIAMEQFDTGQQAALDAAMRDCADADCVVAKVAIGKSSWTWDFYKPVIQLALDYKLPLLAANLSRADASKVVKDGIGAVLPAGLVARYGLDALPAEVRRDPDRALFAGEQGLAAIRVVSRVALRLLQPGGAPVVSRRWPAGACGWRGGMTAKPKPGIRRQTRVPRHGLAIAGASWYG